ncbi:hypothetical protein BH24DEI2_BH24DEI2_27430 [soil metagenome]
MGKQKILILRPSPLLIYSKTVSQTLAPTGHALYL